MCAKPVPRPYDVESCFNTPALATRPISAHHIGAHIFPKITEATKNDQNRSEHQEACHQCHPTVTKPAASIRRDDLLVVTDETFIVELCLPPFPFGPNKREDLHLRACSLEKFGDRYVYVDRLVLPQLEVTTLAVKLQTYVLEDVGEDGQLKLRPHARFGRKHCQQHGTTAIREDISIRSCADTIYRRLPDELRYYREARQKFSAMGADGGGRLCGKLPNELLLQIVRNLEPEDRTKMKLLSKRLFKAAGWPVNIDVLEIPYLDLKIPAAISKWRKGRWVSVER
jgi:hypothetical protein